MIREILTRPNMASISIKGQENKSNCDLEMSKF